MRVTFKYEGRDIEYWKDADEVPAKGDVIDLDDVVYHVVQRFWKGPRDVVVVMEFGTEEVGRQM